MLSHTAEPRRLRGALFDALNATFNLVEFAQAEDSRLFTLLEQDNPLLNLENPQRQGALWKSNQHVEAAADGLSVALADACGGLMPLCQQLVLDAFTVSWHPAPMIVWANLVAASPAAWVAELVLWVRQALEKGKIWAAVRPELAGLQLPDRALVSAYLERNLAMASPHLPVAFGGGEAISSLADEEGPAEQGKLENLAIAVLWKQVKSGRKINVAAIAREAGVKRSTLYSLKSFKMALDQEREQEARAKQERVEFTNARQGYHRGRPTGRNGGSARDQE